MKTSIIAVIGIIGAMIALLSSIFDLFEFSVVVVLCLILDEITYQRNN